MRLEWIKRKSGFRSCRDRNAPPMHTSSLKSPRNVKIAGRLKPLVFKRETVLTERGALPPRRFDPVLVYPDFQ